MNRVADVRRRLNVLLESPAAVLLLALAVFVITSLLPFGSEQYFFGHG